MVGKEERNTKLGCVITIPLFIQFSPVPSVSTSLNEVLNKILKMAFSVGLQRFSQLLHLTAR